MVRIAAWLLFVALITSSCSARDAARQQSSDEANIRQLFANYLTESGGHPGQCYAESKYWLKAEQEKSPCYDLAGMHLNPYAKIELSSLRRLDGSPLRYEVVAAAHDTSAEFKGHAFYKDMRITYIAVRDNNQWYLSSALSERTRDWQRATVGPITYVVQPGITFNANRARSAVQFTDSIAREFGTPPMKALRYFMTHSRDDAFAVIGLESAVKVGTGGGFANFGMIFSGTPSEGEEYRHELAHVVLAPLYSANTSTAASEGLPSWLGGTAGMDYRATVASLGRILDTSKTLNLDLIINGSMNAEAFRPAVALLTAMVFERGGVDAVKRFMHAGPSSGAMKKWLEELFGTPWGEIATEWRRRALRPPAPLN